MPPVTAAHAITQCTLQHVCCRGALLFRRQFSTILVQSRHLRGDVSGCVSDDQNNSVELLTFSQGGVNIPTTAAANAANGANIDHAPPSPDSRTKDKFTGLHAYVQSVAVSRQVYTGKYERYTAPSSKQDRTLELWKDGKINREQRRADKSLLKSESRPAIRKFLCPPQSQKEYTGAAGSKDGFGNSEPRLAVRPSKDSAGCKSGDNLEEADSRRFEKSCVHGKPPLIRKFPKKSSRPETSDNLWDKETDSLVRVFPTASSLVLRYPMDRAWSQVTIRKHASAQPWLLAARSYAINHLNLDLRVIDEAPTEFWEELEAEYRKLPQTTKYSLLAMSPEQLRRLNLPYQPRGNMGVPDVVSLHPRLTKLVADPSIDLNIKKAKNISNEELESLHYSYKGPSHRRNVASYEAHTDNTSLQQSDQFPPEICGSVPSRQELNAKFFSLINEELARASACPQAESRLGQARMGSSNHGTNRLAFSRNLSTTGWRFRQSHARQAFSTYTMQNAVAQPLEINPRYEPGVVDSEESAKTPQGIRDSLVYWQTEHEKEESKRISELGVQLFSLSFGGSKALGDDAYSAGDESNSLDSGADSEEGIPDAKSNLMPGDLIEILFDNQCVLAVFVRRFNNQCQLFTQFGRWIHLDGAFMRYFWVQSWVDPSELRSIMPFMPTSEVPSGLLAQWNGPIFHVPQLAGQMLVQKMSDFTRAADETYREHAEKIDDAHNLLCKSKELSWRSIVEITRKILDISADRDLPRSTEWAVHRALLMHNMAFVPEGLEHWRTGVFEILSSQELQLINQIQHWVRDHQEFIVRQANKLIDKRDSGYTSPQTSVLNEFARRIRPVVEENRRYRKVSPFGNLGPSSVQVDQISGHNKSLSFRSVVLGRAEPSDSLILRFVELWTARRNARPGSPLWALGPMLLRASGVYDDVDWQHSRYDMTAGFTFLQDVGVIAPWENRCAFNTRLALPGHGFDLKADELLVSAAESTQTWSETDVLDNIRQDWGDLEVFCVDSASATEIDDGFSVESVPGDDHAYWIHVHIANPTAYISQDSAVAAYAERMTETIYFPEKRYNMLPPGIVQGHFSLAPGRPVLSFSAKLTADGDMLETKITPSRIHRVTYVTPETVTRHLVPKDLLWKQSMQRFIVGNIPPPENSGRRSIMTRELSAVQFENLKLIKNLSLAHHQKRISSDGKEGRLKLLGSTISLRGHSESQVYYTQSEFPWRRVFRRIEGDPTIVLTASGFQPDFSEGRRTFMDVMGLIPTIMQLACSIAGSWCASRGISNIFRGTESMVFDIPDLTSRLRDLNADMEKNPSRAWLTLVDYSSRKYVSKCSTKPLRHDMLGVDAYIRATSPLRRYSDMIAHWQIQTALLEEAKLGRAFTGVDAPRLAFSEQRLVEFVPALLRRERIIKTSMGSAERHWMMQLLLRSLHYGEGQPPLPEFLHGFVSGSYKSFWRIIIKEIHLPLKFDIVNKEEFNSDILVGDWWVMKLEGVHTYGGTLKTRLVERISRIAK